MWSFNVLLLSALYMVGCSCHNVDEPTLYYYGLEESERSLRQCAGGEAGGEACGAVVRRYWRAPALVRLCRCARRQRCDSLAQPTHIVQLNNRAHLQFCEPVTDWEECSFNSKALTVVTSNNHMNPDELEEMHHNNIQLTPPKIIFSCRCQSPNYWKLNSSSGDTHVYQCASLPICSTDEFCGNVNFHLYALYQSCLCPKHHICVHNGGIPQINMNELLYNGKGWKAYCRKVESDYSYEDY